MTVVRTDAAPAPAHTFSQGIRKGGLLQVSGQGPMDPATNTYIGEGDVTVQTRRTLENVKAILQAGGAVGVRRADVPRLPDQARGLRRDERRLR